MDGEDIFKDLIITGVEFTSRVLGRGAFGEIVSVEYNGMQCAAKKIKPDRLGSVTGDHTRIKQCFLQQCLRGRKLMNPNIMRMFGLCYHPGEADIPRLVMELMECNVTQLLERYQNIPMYVKLSILQDISNGLSYLHTQNPPIMHCNLDSYNILLTPSLIAKIHVFGGIYIYGEMPVNPLSLVDMIENLGTCDFMPPEAFRCDSHYGLPLDVFSFGCVVCHVMTQRWPKPWDEEHIVDHQNTNTRKPFTEVERCKDYINQISEKSLQRLVKKCLDDVSERRPAISLVSKKMMSIVTDHYSKDINIKMAYSLAMKEGQAQSRDLQLLLVGAENSGKTCLISSFIGEKFVEGNSPTQGAEVEVCKIYCRNWSRISDSNKTVELLHHQFIDRFKGNALRMMLPNKSTESSTPFSHNALEYTCAAPTEYVNASTGGDLPEPHLQDVKEASSDAIQYDTDSLNAVLWDFAGQVIYLNSHSMFISESGIAVIVFNASGKLTDKVVPREDSPQPAEYHTVISGIHYWLQVVDSMCSVKEKVLLAGTHIDKIHPDIKQARKIAKERIVPQLEKEFFGKPYSQCLFGYHEGLLSALEQCCYFVSNKCRDEGIEHLKNATIKAAISLRIKQPIFFLKIEQALLQHKEPVISKSMMLDLVTKATFSVAEDSLEFKGVLRYFHNKRTILYFSEIESLTDLVILSPHWLAKLLSYVIAAQSYKTGFAVDGAWKRLTEYGILEESLLQHMLDKFHSDYPSILCVTKQQVVNILLSFHLVARITREAWFSEEGYPSLPDCGDAFVVPSLVPQDDKNIPNTKQEKIVYFKFERGFIPTSLLNQLIADYICRNVKRNDRLLWMRHGKVGLQLGCHQKYYISRCEEKQSIQLTITVRGDEKRERRELIDDVTQLLGDIMKVFMPEVKKPTLMVPCPLCPKLHITLSEVSTGNTIFCPRSGDAPLPSGYYSDLIPVYQDYTKSWQIKLMQTPEMWDLIDIVIPKVKASWVEVAYSMGYSVIAVRGFETDGRNSNEQCRKLFKDWLTTGHGCTPKTWETLLQQIKQVTELTAAVKEVEEQLSCKLNST